MFHVICLNNAAALNCVIELNRAKQTTGVYLASYFGLREAVIALLENGHNSNSKDTYGQAPLWLAAGNGL